MMVGNTSRPNSTTVGIAQGKRPRSASVGRGVAPSATQAQDVRHIKTASCDCQRAKPFGGLMGGRALFLKTGPKILVGTECSGLESVTVAFDKMDLGDRAQLQFICEKDTAARNLILAHRHA